MKQSKPTWLFLGLKLPTSRKIGIIGKHPESLQISVGFHCNENPLKSGGSLRSQSGTLKEGSERSTGIMKTFFKKLNDFLN
jgi:hypothetical protein